MRKDELLKKVAKAPILFEKRQSGALSARQMKADFAHTSVARFGLSPVQFAAVLAAKGARSSAAFDNSPFEIQSLSLRAFSEKSASAAISLITQIKGVGISVGSAFLAWAQPHKFAVMDFHTKRTASRFGLIEFNEKSIDTQSLYCAFNKSVSEFSADIPCDPQELDVWMYNYSIDTWGRRRTNV